jgi:hypothetical protein
MLTVQLEKMCRLRHFNLDFASAASGIIEVDWTSRSTVVVGSE